MRVLLKSAFSSEEAIKKMKSEGILPKGVSVKEDAETGRKYFNYIFRLSTDVDVLWHALYIYVEAVSNIVTTFCDLKPEGIYEWHKGFVRTLEIPPEITAIVVLKRDHHSGVTWEEIEFYSEDATPREIGEAYSHFRKGEFHPVTNWSGGVPHSPDTVTKIT